VRKSCYYRYVRQAPGTHWPRPLATFERNKIRKPGLINPLDSLRRPNSEGPLLPVAGPLGGGPVTVVTVMILIEDPD
jgi:hypothetical protein